MGLDRCETVTLDSFVATQPILWNIRCEIDFSFAFVSESLRSIAVTSGPLPIKHDGRKVRAQWLACCYCVSESLCFGKKRHLLYWVQKCSQACEAPVLSIIHLLPIELTHFFLNISSSMKGDGNCCQLLCSWFQNVCELHRSTNQHHLLYSPMWPDRFTPSNPLRRPVCAMQKMSMALVGWHGNQITAIRGINKAVNTQIYKSLKWHHLFPGRFTHTGMRSDTFTCVNTLVHPT